MYMKTRRKNFAILIFLSVIVMSILMLFNMLTAQTTIALGDNATPDVYSNFLYYAGKDNFYYADIYYKKLIGANELPSAQIKLKRTRLEDGLWSSISVSSVKISLITPSDTYVATINKNSEEIILFYRTHIYEEGTYTVKASGNISAGASVVQSASFTFVVDKTPPTGTLTGVTNGGYTNGNVSFNWSENGCTATLDGSSYTAGKTISAEGSHTIVLTDKAGNSTMYTFTIDKTAPIIDAYNAYTNKSFTLTAKDKFNGVEYWEYRLNSGEILRCDGEALTIGGSISDNGVWEVRVFDFCGNGSAWEIVNHFYRETFGNSDNIRNSYFVPSYFVVTLSQKYYTSCYGSYTFAEYSSAFSFAIQKEWECRVIILDGGSSWNYVTVNNENTRQIYTDINELNSVIDKYARKNIGDRKVMGKNGAVLNNPTDAEGVTRPDALTEQIVELPQLLSDYSSLRFMLAPFSYSLSVPRSYVDGNNSSASIKFISDGISLREESARPLEYGLQLKEIVTEQGWYLITENDVCGNIEQYLIYLDLQQPDFYADVAYGNGVRETIEFNQNFIDSNAGAMRYVEFAVNSLSDSLKKGCSNTMHRVEDRLKILKFSNITSLVNNKSQ